MSVNPSKNNVLLYSKYLFSGWSTLMIPIITQKNKHMSRGILFLGLKCLLKNKDSSDTFTYLRHECFRNCWVIIYLKHNQYLCENIWKQWGIILRYLEEFQLKSVEWRKHNEPDFSCRAAGTFTWRTWYSYLKQTNKWKSIMCPVILNKISMSHFSSLKM